ncbi:hypothetical protein FS837_010350 [Tulasnella sp. UAMH 9824]|nr:hypothetical protein FS837_010350 [Tulasnella sp. UAMH 9824]
MENYGRGILRTILYDIALNRQSLQVDPESQPAPDGVGFEDLEHAVRSVQRFLGEAIRTIAAESRSRRSSPSILPVELFLWVVKDVLAGTDRHRNAAYYGQLTKLCLVCKEWADTIHNNEYLIERLLTRSASRLQELTLVGPGDWSPSIKLFDDTAPRLEVVTVRGCGLPWRSPILFDFKKLSLWGIEENFPQLDALLDILASSLRLSELAITTIHIQLDSDTSSRRVKLPDLRSLRVEYLYPEVTMAILNSIDAPLSASCIFSTELEDGEEVAVELAGISERLVALARSVGNDSATLTLQPSSMDMAGCSPGDEEWDAVLKYEPEGDRLGPLSITVNAHPKKYVGIFNDLSGRIQPYTKASPPKLRLSKRAPTLKKLILDGSQAGWMPLTNIFEGTAPQLEAVTVVGYELPWSSPVLFDLRELTLWRIEEHAPQIDTLLDILASSPRLRKLVLGFIDIQLNTYYPSRRVALPNLRSLKVEDPYAETVAAVLKSIDAPLSATCTFSMEMGGGKEMAVELADVSERLVALARSVHNGSCTLNLKMGSKTYSPEDDGWHAILIYETGEDHLGPISITVGAPPKEACCRTQPPCWQDSALSQGVA